MIDVMLGILAVGAVLLVQLGLLAYALNRRYKRRGKHRQGWDIS